MIILYHDVSCCTVSALLPAQQSPSIFCVDTLLTSVHQHVRQYSMSPRGPRSRLLISSRYVKPAKPIAPPGAAHHRAHRAHWTMPERIKNLRSSPPTTPAPPPVVAPAISPIPAPTGMDRPKVKTAGTSQSTSRQWALPRGWRKPSSHAMTQL